MWGDEDVGTAPVRTVRRQSKAKTRTPSILRHHSAGAAEGISPAVPSAAAALTRAMPERSLSEQPPAPQRQRSWGDSSSDDDASLPAFHGAESRDALTSATGDAANDASDRRLCDAVGSVPAASRVSARLDLHTEKRRAAQHCHVQGAVSVRGLAPAQLSDPLRQCRRSAPRR